jgi:hypothetical protein
MRDGVETVQGGSIEGFVDEYGIVVAYELWVSYISESGLRGTEDKDEWEWTHCKADYADSFEYSRTDEGDGV